MIKINLPSGKSADLEVIHLPDRSTVNGHRVTHRTVARLKITSRVDSWEWTYEGDAYCSAHDHFKRKTGTRTAVARALEDAKLSKADRTAIWRRLWNLNRPKPQPKTTPVEWLTLGNFQPEPTLADKVLTGLRRLWAGVVG